MAIAGHVSQKSSSDIHMFRSEARRQAGQALSAKPLISSLNGSKTKGYDTTHKAMSIPSPEVVEKKW
jgi:hypothetical protein